MNVPWLELIEIDVTDDIEIDLLAGDLFSQVVAEELLLSWVEAEARRDTGLAVDGDAHCFLALRHLVEFEIISDESGMR